MDINFDESSAAWRINKKYIGNGYFVYTSKCNKLTKTGKQCSRLCKPNSNYCFQHSK